MFETDQNTDEQQSLPPEDLLTNPDQEKEKKPSSPKKGADSKKSEEPPVPGKKNWYILKVQVNRENAIKENLEKRYKVAGLQDYFGKVLVPTEKITEIRGDKKKVVTRKLYPGYIMVYMEINDDTWFLVRETSGIGDFTGAVGKPTPMLEHEVQRILASEAGGPTEQPKLKVGYEVGQQIKVKTGTFEGYHGTVQTIDFASGIVTVIINLFGRSTPVELEYWQIEQNLG